MKKLYVEGEFLKKAPNSKLLYHQYRTMEALKEYSVVFNTYPTGAGKTRAVLERLKENQQDNVLFIAPTNELLIQHAEDITEFVENNDLQYKVVRVDAKVIKKIKNESNDKLRKGTILYEILRNPLEYKEQLGIQKTKGKIIVVVNPDIFYYCVYGFYNNLDKANLMDIVITKFNYVIIDEFHYYNSKQLTNFLYFMMLSKELGYFDGTRRFCILTATPDKLIEKYLTKGDIDYKILSIENEPEESKDYEIIKTLSKMELYITNKSLEEAVLEEYKDNDFQKDSVVISQSLFRVNKIKQTLYRNKINKQLVGVITGAISSKERKEAVYKKIILATPTVDIGYNFKKEGKNSQNIDLVITEAETNDEALQRIGRAGRILGKDKQDDTAKVVLCVKDTIYNAFKEDKDIISRIVLKDIIQSAMPSRNIMKRYISSGSIIEFCFPLEELRRKFPYENRDDIIGKLFNNLVDVFAGTKKSCSYKRMMDKIKDYKAQMKFLSDYKKSINKEEFIICEQNKNVLSNKLIGDAINQFQNYDEKIDSSELNEYSKDELNEVKINFKDEIVEYLRIETSKIKALTNFRGSNIGISTLVYDKHNIFSQEDKVFKYDIFHLMRYYDIYWYRDKKEIENELSKYKVFYDHSLLNECDVFLRIDEIKENSNKIAIEMTYKDGNKKEFEAFYKDDVKAVTDLIVTVYEKNKIGNIGIPIPEAISNYFKEEYIPILIITNPKDEYQIRKIIKNQPIYMIELNVNFRDDASQVYSTIIGSDAILVDYEIIRIRDKFEKDEALIY